MTKTTENETETNMPAEITKVATAIKQKSNTKLVITQRACLIGYEGEITSLSWLLFDKMAAITMPSQFIAFLIPVLN